MRTFKVERVVSAEMLPQAFELPADLDIDALLSSAWGIIWGEGHVVKLRFSPTCGMAGTGVALAPDPGDRRYATTAAAC